jgi:hypothetical protein
MQTFQYEREIRLPLIERLLHLMFIIRLNTFREFSVDLTDFLLGFRNSYERNYEITLTPQWLGVIQSQIKNYNSARSCIDFLEMVRLSGEPYVKLVKYVTSCLSLFIHFPLSFLSHLPFF